jgi:hypothetical protein
MLAAIYFHNYFRLKADEINEERPDAVLAPKFHSQQPSVTQYLPKLKLRRCLLFAKQAGTLDVGLAAHDCFPMVGDSVSEQQDLWDRELLFYCIGFSPHPPFGHLLPTSGEKGGG